MISASRGTYILCLYLKQEQIIEIGKLGTCLFPAGYYTYTGSAFGPGGLSGRLKHHLNPGAKPHWHIDYLRRKSEIEAVWLSEQKDRREHEYAAILQQMKDSAALFPGFGSSDCKCRSHLFYFQHYPRFSEFRGRVLKKFPEEVLRRWEPAMC